MPSSISGGQSAVLDWTVTNATDVVITPGVGDVTTSTWTTVSPVATTTYTLTAYGTAGRASQTVAVTVMPTITAVSCNTGDVQTAINSASEGETVLIPACPSGVSWTSGMNISGKGITLQGAGAGRVIAVSISNSAIPIANGVVSFPNVQAANVAGNLTITPGETLRIIENGFVGNFMQGAVTNYSGGALAMNITSSGGACGASAPAGSMQSNCKRWLIATLPSTVLINNLTSGSMINITEDTSVHAIIAGIHFAQGSSGGGTGEEIYLTRNNPSGAAILIHDNFFESNQADLIDGDTNRGVIWNNSFVFSPFSQGQWAAIRIQDGNNTALSTSWQTASTMGAADTNGQNNLYFEANDVHADGDFTDISDNARMVVRYNFLNNAGGSTHGADTGFIGMRHFEYYNNVGIFQGYSDGTTANMNWWMFVRGGTFVWFNNNLQAISSQDTGTKSDIDMTVMTLQREDNYACWGSNQTVGGQYYHAPRQVGMGNVTGAGTVTYSPLGYNNASVTTNANDYIGSVYVGDSEPIYIWNNNRTMNVGISDYGQGNGATSCQGTVDTSTNYIIAGRDYFNNGTAKPGYTPYTYPHPLTLGNGGLGGNPSSLTINTTSLPGGTVGSAYSQTLGASGGTPPYTWSVTSGSLPAGLSLAAASGQISGTPTTAGTASFTIQVKDSANATVAEALSIVIGSAGGGGGTTPSTPTDLSNVRVYPNPWRSDKHSGLPVTFANLPAGSTVKIFTVSGHLVKTLGPGPSALGTLLWDLTTDSGDKAASGVYVFLVKDAQGDKTHGKVALIK